MVWEHFRKSPLVCTGLPNSFPIFFPKLPPPVDRETVRNWDIPNCRCFNTLRQAFAVGIELRRRGWTSLPSIAFTRSKSSAIS